MIAQSQAELERCLNYAKENKLLTWGEISAALWPDNEPDTRQRKQEILVREYMRRLA
jgi:hypothetical protein